MTPAPVLKYLVCPHAEGGEQLHTGAGNDGMPDSPPAGPQILINAFAAIGWVGGGGAGGVWGGSLHALLNALGIFLACHWLWITASPFRLLSADLFFLIAGLFFFFYQLAPLVPFRGPSVAARALWTGPGP